MQTKQLTLTIEYDDSRFHTSPGYWDWTLLIGLPNTTLNVTAVIEKDISLERFTTKDLFALAFGDTRLSLRKIRSVHLSDCPIHRVKSIPYELGKLLVEQDPEENFFHVEFFTDEATPAAEIWSAQAWKESLTHKLKHSRDDTSEVARRQVLMRDIAYFIARTTKCGGARASDVAKLIISFDDSHDYLLEIFKAPAELLQRLKDYRHGKSTT